MQIIDQDIRNLAGVYRGKVARLQETLNSGGVRSEAAELRRGLIEEIPVTPDNDTGTLKVDMKGELRAILALCDAHKKNRLAGDEAGRFLLVAEVRCRREAATLHAEV